MASPQGTVPSHSSQTETGFSPEKSQESLFTASLENGTTQDRSSFFRRYLNSFKRADEVKIDTTGMTEEEIKNAQIQSAPMSEGLNALQVSLIAIGGSIGSGLLVSSGNNLATGGAGGTVLSYGILGVMVFLMMHALGELSVRWPKLSMAMQTHRTLDDSLAFSMGWIYFLNWLVALPLELVATAITIQYWQSDAAKVNPAAWVSLFWVAQCVIAFQGVSIYGWSEAILSITKLVAVLGFCIFGIVIVAGGGPTHHYFGTHYWHVPGAFLNGAKGTITCFIAGAFSLSGIELVGLASAEAKNPAASLPRAVRSTFWRVILFYIVSLVICFCLVRADNPKLGTSSDGNASPFVLAILASGVGGLPTVMNIVILLSAFSVGNASLYGSSRSLAAIAHAGGAPKILGYVDREGRPIVSLGLTMAFSLIAFIVAAPNYQKAFNWLQAISGQATMFVWAFISLSHIMLRIALKKQGRSIKEQHFNSPYGIAGSVISFFITIIILALEIWTALFPVGGSPNAYDFFETWVSLPIAVVLFVGHKAYYRRSPIYPSTMDLVTESRIKTPEQIERDECLYEEERRNTKPIVWYSLRFFRLFC